MALTAKDSCAIKPNQNTIGWFVGLRPARRKGKRMERLGIEPLSVFGLPPVAFVNLAADLGLRYIAIMLSAMPNPYGYPPFS